VAPCGWEVVKPRPPKSLHLAPSTPTPWSPSPTLWSPSSTLSSLEMRDASSQCIFLLHFIIYLENPAYTLICGPREYRQRHKRRGCRTS
jgi:hypothetical protein